MKILISDKMSNKVEDILKSKQIDFDIKTGMSPEELKEVIDQYDGILIRSATKLTSDILVDCKNLKVIGRAGVGVDNVDLTSFIFELDKIYFIDFNLCLLLFRVLR